MNLEMFLPLQVFRIVSERYVLTPLNVWKNSPVKSSGPGLFVYREVFKSQIQYQYL